MNVLFLSPGIGEIGVVVVLIFLLFGGEQTPKIAKTIGSALKEFKKIINDIRNNDE